MNAIFGNTPPFVRTPTKYPFLNLLLGPRPNRTSHVQDPFQGLKSGGDLNAAPFSSFLLPIPLQFFLPYLSSGTAARSAWAARRRSSSCWSPRSTSCIRDRGSATAARLKFTQVKNLIKFDSFLRCDSKVQGTEREQGS